MLEGLSPGREVAKNGGRSRGPKEDCRQEATCSQTEVLPDKQ